ITDVRAGGDEDGGRADFWDHVLGAAPARLVDLRHELTVRRRAIRFPLGPWEVRMPGTPPEIDTSRPHSARMYDYFIGGKNHFAADREAAAKALAAWPEGRTGPRENRAVVGPAGPDLAGEAGGRPILDPRPGPPHHAHRHHG